MIAKQIKQDPIGDERDTLPSFLDDLDEQSGVYPSARSPLRCGLVFSASSPSSTSEPRAVYATPCWIEGNKRSAFGTAYYLGTRFETGIIESAAWEEEMARDGVPEHVVEQARAYLEANGL